MKNIVYVLFSVLLLFISSCSKEGSSVVTPYAEKVGGAVDSQTVKGGITSTVNSSPFMTKYDSKRYELAKVKNGRAAAYTEYGPFTVNANLTRIRQNEKLILDGNKQSIYTTGAYFCDVYVCDYTVTLPSGGILLYRSASKTGYANYTNQDKGVLVNQNPSSNQYTIFTHSIVPRTNTAGQNIYAGTIPEDLTGTTFTYSYLLP